MIAPALPMLDEQTRDELQPPCEGRGRQCGNPAGWIIRYHCEACGWVNIMLACTDCKNIAVDLFKNPQQFHVGCPKGRRYKVMRLDSIEVLQ